VSWRFDGYHHRLTGRFRHHLRPDEINIPDSATIVHR
jgi:hypothetical protein